MKYNLKNRPKMIWDEKAIIAFIETRRWFEGFEEELREMLRVMRARKKISKRASDFFFEIKQIKEILGDDSGRTVKEHKGPFVLYIKDPENYDSTDSSTSDD